MKKLFFISLLIFLQSCNNNDTIDPNDPWGQITTDEPEFYAASDVNESIIELTKTWYRVAANTWGNYGPTEYWIVGKSESASAELDKLYCDIRKEKSGHRINNCLNRDYDFISYAKDGNAGLNLRRDQGDSWDGFIITMSAKRPSPDEEDYKSVSLHEYFHIYQHAHVFSKKRSERDAMNKKNPWWMEGGAEYMGHLLYSKQPDVSEGYLKERMTWKMETKSELNPGERISEIEYGSRGNIAYDLGSWFIAYIISRSSLDSYLINFYDNLNELGFEESFVKNFDVSSQEMLDDFHNIFLKLPIEDQLNIIP